MNNTELAIITQLAELDESQQEEVLRFLQQLGRPSTEDAADWFERAEAVRASVRATQGDVQIDVVGLLRSIREDEEWAILSSTPIACLPVSCWMNP